MSGLAVLGVANRCAGRCEDVLSVAGPAALVALVTDAARVADRRARMALACRLAAEVDAFLPVASGVLSREEVETWLARDAASLSQQLDVLRGCAEMVCTVPVCAAAEVAQAEGAWLRARAARLDARRLAVAQAEDRAAAVVAALADLACASRITPFGTAGIVRGLDLSLLIRRADVAALRRRVGASDIGLSGPWPCFSFAAVAIPERVPA